jgi:N-acetylneuraminic acid mutarotase
MDDTWAFDPREKKWTQMEPGEGPGALAEMMTAYDAESDRIIFFGGFRAGQDVNKTWAYDFNTNTWTRMSSKPKPRSQGGMVYDSESDRIILFGGWLDEGMSASLDEKYGDTWAYDFNTDSWERMEPNPSPPPRCCFQMAYDSESDRVIIWGGWGKGEHDKHVWAYDYNANTWEKLGLFDDAPAPWGGSVYDAESDRMVIYGGGERGSTDTWAYDYNTDTWTEMEPELAPEKLFFPAMVYIAPLDQILLFGGVSYEEVYIQLDQTWLYDLNSNTWEMVTFNQE